MISSSWVYESSVQMHEIHVGWIVLVLFYLSVPLILRGFTHKEGKMLAGVEDVRENSMNFEL